MATTDPDLPVLLFDGDCAFCSSCARYVERNAGIEADLVPWQWTDLDSLGVDLDEVDRSVVWVTDPDRHTTGPRAVADLLLSSRRRWWRLAGRCLSPRPVQRVARPVYRWIARNRHRMPGGTAQCSLPQAQRDQPSRTEPGPTSRSS